MSQWTVEMDDRQIERVSRWPRAEQLELLAVQRLLERGGPEALGLVKAELEGVPAWNDLGAPVSLMLPIQVGSGWRTLMLEVQPDRRLLIEAFA